LSYNILFYNFLWLIGGYGGLGLGCGNIKG